MAERTRCPFYGFHFVPEQKVMVDSNGNQCALAMSAYSPCQMEIAGNEPYWWLCPRNPFAGVLIHPAELKGGTLFRTWFEERTKS
jgi:hypothetical protein